MKFNRSLGFLVVLAWAYIGLLYVLPGAAVAFPGEPRGFEGFNWGIKKEDLGNMKYVGRDSSGMVLFEKDGGEDHFGKAKIAGIEYGFRDGRLAAVRVRVDSLLQYLLVKDEAAKRYGAGGKMPGGEEDYVWYGEETEITLVGRFTES